jgi:hypothetical protein
MELKALKKWTMPDDYSGEVWPEYYVFLGQNRDSDVLTRSNFESGLEAIGGEDGDLVVVVREGHWAVGWIEWIGIHQDAEDILKEADEILCALEDYPVVDDEHLSNLELEEAEEVWTNCYNEKERIKYIRDHRNQFEFRSFADMLGCVRGKYFCGYASELIY